MNPSCLSLGGILSPVVDSATAVSGNVPVTLPPGTYSVVPVGIETSGSCEDIPTLFSKPDGSNPFPQIYVLGPAGTFQTVSSRFSARSTYDGQSATDLVNACLPTTFVKSISTGYNHSCALVNSGVKCWGSGNLGELGTGAATSSGVAQPVAFLSAATAIGTGRNYSCAIDGGAAKCWGINDSGQLGKGAVGNTLAPVQVTGGLTSGVTFLSVGTEHACAVHNGAAKCWGNNDQGKLGDGSFSSAYGPVNVIGLSSGVTAVSAGQTHSCAIKDGRAYCWGENGGRLGDGGTNASPIPLPVLGPSSGFSEISAGLAHSCAIIDRRVYCWGSGATGALGNGAPNTVYVPDLVTGIGLGAQGISAGLSGTCVLLNGVPYCWGENGTGQIGNGGTVTEFSPTVLYGQPSGARSISRSIYLHSCAAISGVAKCWGHNGSGQLGNDSITDSYVPVTVLGIVP